jgi:TonB-dependent receptor
VLPLHLAPKSSTPADIAPARHRSPLLPRRLRHLLLTTFASTMLGHARAQAQAQPKEPRATIHGTVVDDKHLPIVAAVIRVAPARLGAVTDDAGAFTINGVAAGSYTLIVHRVGFAPDSTAIHVGSGETLVHDFVLHAASARRLAAVVVSASPRLNETKEQALDKQRNAENLVTVLSGDEIRALPNANAAEAIARIPGISTERDEGEGKFVQIRGTEPRLSNVTINGAHVPGTEMGSRVAKLDAIPTDLLGAIEVSKTLTADMDADAIGGSVNLVTKTPEGAPRGYLAGQLGQASLLARKQGQGSLMYGGRYGADRQLGILFGGTYDRNDRSINDLEMAWSADGAGRVTPVEWDQRDYVYDRTRYGAGGDVDYRFADGSTAFVKGMWSKFDNFGTRYRYDLALAGDSAQAASGATGIGTGAALVRESQRRTPREQLWGVTGGGKKLLGVNELTYAIDYAGTRQDVRDYRTNDFEYDGPGGSGLAVRYDGSNHNVPTYQYLSASDAALATTPGNFALSRYTATNGLTTGRDVGGGLDLLLRYMADPSRASLKLGVKYRDETKSFLNQNGSYAPTTPFMLSQVVGDFSDPGYYQSQSSAFQMGPQPNQGATTAWENANAAQFASTASAVKNALASFSGGEKISAAYAMHSSELGALHVNLGLRIEHTAVSYFGNVATTPADASGNATGPATVRAVPGTQSYSDVFPSLQLRYAVNPDANVRFALTRGIARANYGDLAPHLSAELCSSCQAKFGNLSAGNPNLLPQHSLNVDLLGERFIGSNGVLSGGLFYKKISDFIYKRQFVYDGPATEFNGYYGTQPQNGGDGHLLGSEVTYTQKLAFLPGAMSGLGFDVNWTHVDSKAQLLADTAHTAATLGSPVVRYAPLARQAKNIANAALTFDARVVSLRAAWQYQGASIYSYGDGSASPSGDNWFFPHSQIDASLILNATSDVSVQVQALNLNNAVFGFFNGAPGSEYANQREYYGRSVIVGVKYGFGALPGSK